MNQVFPAPDGECVPVTQQEQVISYLKDILIQMINAFFGKGVAELIEERRMETAEEMLKTTSLSVLDISEKVGYSTPRYFSTRFKQLHGGLTPLKFRSKYRV